MKEIKDVCIMVPAFTGSKVGYEKSTSSNNSGRTWISAGVSILREYKKERLISSGRFWKGVTKSWDLKRHKHGHIFKNMSSGSEERKPWNRDRSHGVCMLEGAVTGTMKQTEKDLGRF